MADPTYKPYGWWQGDREYSREGGWRTQRYVTDVPTLYDWVRRYWSQYAPDAAVAPTGQAALRLSRAKSDPRQFTSDVTSYMRGLGDIPNAIDLTDLNTVDTGIGTSLLPLGIEQEALMQALGLFLHNSQDAMDMRQQSFTQVGMTNEEVAAVVQDLLSNPNAPPPAQWDLFRQAFDETAIMTMESWNTGLLPVAKDEQIQYALNPADPKFAGKPPVPFGTTAEGLENNGVTQGGEIWQSKFGTGSGSGGGSHVIQQNPYLQQINERELEWLRETGATPETIEAVRQQQIQPLGNQGTGMQGFADGAGVTGNAEFMRQMDEWQRGLDFLATSMAGNPAAQAAAIQQYLAINPAPNPALASQLATDVSTAALGASGGLSTGGSGINEALSGHYTGQNYIQSSDGVLSQQGRVNPDMATHLQALARMQAAEGVFDPDVAAYLAQMRAINNPYALFHSWTNPLPDTDERWLGQYYMNYDPPSNQGGGYVPPIRTPGVIGAEDIVTDTSGVNTRSANRRLTNQEARTAVRDYHIKNPNSAKTQWESPGFQESLRNSGDRWLETNMHAIEPRSVRDPSFQYGPKISGDVVSIPSSTRSLVGSAALKDAAKSTKNEQEQEYLSGYLSQYGR